MILSFSKTETLHLKGVAILLVLVGHCVPGFFPYAEIYVPIKRLVSQLGVEIFLIISGVGVSLTYLHSTSNPLYFLLKRLVTLWPLYCFSMLCYYVVCVAVFHDDTSIEDLISNLLWVQVFVSSQDSIYSAAHFFSVLLVVYLLSLVMMFAQTMMLKYVVFLVSTLAFQTVCYQVYGSFLFSDYIASFSFGLVFGFLIKKSEKSLYSIILLINFIYCFFDEYSLLKAVLGVCLFGLVLIKMRQLCSVKVVQFLAIMGTNSYVIYLGHNFFLWKWPEILGMTNSVSITGGIIVLFTTTWLLVLFLVNKIYVEKITIPYLKSLKINQ